MTLIINAANVHTGGGFALLSALMENLAEDFQGRFILDERFHLSAKLPDNVVVYRIRPTVWDRLRNEWFLRRFAGPNDVVLCFGNLPPVFRLRATVLVLLQNRYQIDPRSLRGFPMFPRFRITLERILFKWGKRNVTCFIVQSPSMQRAVKQVLGVRAAVLPFLKDALQYARRVGIPSDSKKTKETKGSFLYVASGEPHKNHRNLIEAWTLLAKEGIRPDLCLTIDKDRFCNLCGWIEDKIGNFGLNVTNVGSISAQDIERLYKNAFALIYPSDLESLGLPLIEARCAGLPILASERDYVRDAVDPEETFDPCSPVSIARAVKRFLGIPETPLPIVSPREYLARIVEIAQT
jgi:glycosyltransferase involved in cell wall biosynthesis